ncbi:predicted protein [Nematostella vectensis]|uniref:Uncharacterized protein n=1 Tax=Nematostella vectensis TaxID=45351 RepID=A7RXC4_NEMVE|nr:predicted protein [Nematostella vectensis]|eukprot:XP_001636004.1 predicted protein [Nematostella vectensis]
MLPRIAESCDEKIQDFCETLGISSDRTTISRLDVRSNITGGADEFVNPADRKWALSRAGNLLGKRLPHSSSRFRKSVIQTQHLLAVRQKRKVTPPPQESNGPGIIDLRTQRDSRATAIKLYKDELGFGSGNDQRIRRHVSDFEKSDFTFPGLWSNEEILERINKETSERKELFEITPKEKVFKTCTVLSEKKSRKLPRCLIRHHSMNLEKKCATRVTSESLDSHSSKDRKTGMLKFDLSLKLPEEKQEKSCHRIPMLLSSNNRTQRIRDLGYYAKGVKVEAFALVASQKLRQGRSPPTSKFSKLEAIRSFNAFNYVRMNAIEIKKKRK